MRRTRSPIPAPGQAPLSIEGITPRIFAEHLSVRRYLAERGDTLQSQGFDVDAISPSMIAAAEPSALATSLFGSGVVVDREKRGKHGIFYKGKNDRLNVVALSASERKIYTDNAAAYGRGAYRQVDASPAHQLALNPDEEAPLRAIGHTLSPKAAKMRAYADNELENRLQLIHRFTEALGYPNLARFGGELPIRIAGAELEVGIIESMLEALQDQRAWSLHQKDLARNTILARMFIFRKGDTNLRYARDFLAVNKTHIEIKKRAFLGGAAVAEQYVEENKPSSSNQEM